MPACPVDFRTREGVRRHIEAHQAARRAYGEAAAWKMAAEAQNPPVAQIDQASLRAFEAYEEMTEAARRLLIVMPIDPKALVDLTTSSTRRREKVRRADSHMPGD